METRWAFLADSAAIGISHKVVRPREIERLMEKAVAAGDLQLVAKAPRTSRTRMR
jgi:hypothetical protein